MGTPRVIRRSQPGEEPVWGVGWVYYLAEALERVGRGRRHCHLDGSVVEQFLDLRRALAGEEDTARVGLIGARAA
jgi:hypothetical protein